MKKSVMLLLTFPCLLLSFIALAEDLSSFQVESASDYFSLNVMSYNIQQMGFPGWFDNHFEKQRLEKLPIRILEMELDSDETLPDVIIFQEVFLPSAREYIVQALIDTYPYATQIGGESCSDVHWTFPATNCDENSLRYKLTHNSGVFILSRWPIEESHSLTFVNYRVSYTFDFMARKGAVYARINKQGKLIHVVGTHLQADGGSHDIRMAQLDELKWWIDDFKISNQQALILAGDFNVSSLNTVQFAQMLSRTNAWVQLPKEGLGSVSASTNQYLALIYGGQKEKTLDYILYRADHLQPKNNPEIKALNFKSKIAWVAERYFFDNINIYDISDHYPVSIHYEF